MSGQLFSVSFHWLVISSHCWVWPRVYLFPNRRVELTNTMLHLIRDLSLSPSPSLLIILNSCYSWYVFKVLVDSCTHTILLHSCHPQKVTADSWWRLRIVRLELVLLNSWFMVAHKLWKIIDSCHGNWLWCLVMMSQLGNVHLDSKEMDQLRDVFRNQVHCFFCFPFYSLALSRASWS